MDKLPTFTNLHNIEKMFADYTACEPFYVFKGLAENQIKTIEDTLPTLVTNERLDSEVTQIMQTFTSSFS